MPHLRAVFSIALRLTRREDEARDLTQDAFLRAFDKFDSFLPGTNCKAWLFTVTYSLFINRYRRQQRAPELINTDEQRLALEARSAALESRPVTTLARATAEADVESALAELPEEYRETIIMVDVEELSYEE